MRHLDIKSFAILILTALLGVSVGSTLRASRSGGGGDSARDIIAVTGHYSTGATALYVLDARTMHMAVYRVENGRALELIGARNIAYDLKLESYGDQTHPSLAPAKLRERWEEWVKRGGEGSPPATPRTTLRRSETPGEPAETSPPPEGK